MAQPTILIVEDEPDIRELLEYTLKREGYQVYVASDGVVGLSEARRRIPDLLLLDLMLPGLDGLEVCRRLKQDASTRSVPIVMVTAKGDEADVVLGLSMGADDYVSKPFSTKELIARISAVLRRVNASDDDDRQRTVVHGALRIDPGRHLLEWNGAQIELTATEFRILHYLALSPGRVFSREQILSHALGPLAVVTVRSVDVHVRAIRQKLGAQRELVQTVRGIGYRFADNT
ncbi:MAG: two-component system alkaline phosphatase synthesis response regulator PhoP [Pseudohongiellaceae bacterium]|jgi:two-component system alkaline phosphatase synthesis response regulator PhoP